MVLRTFRTSGRLWTGVNAPLKKISGNTRKGKILWALSGVSSRLATKIPKLPPTKLAKRITGRAARIDQGEKLTLTSKPNAITPRTCAKPTKLSPIILPKTMEAREIGATKILMEKSFSRSVISDTIPIKLL